MIAIFAFFCAWKSLHWFSMNKNLFLTDFLLNETELYGLPINSQRFIQGCSYNYQTNFQQNFFKEIISTKCLHERFSKENWATGFLTVDNDFHCFSFVEKDFDGLLMDEIGSSGFSIDEVSFHSFSINHINLPGFTFKGTNFHALHLYEIVSPGDPLNEVILVFLSPLMKAVFIDSTSEE